MNKRPGQIHKRATTDNPWTLFSGELYLVQPRANRCPVFTAPIGHLLLHGRVHADFRNELAYFATAFDLILSLHHLPPNHPAVADLRESLREQGLR